jgi:hypothetical protein
MYVIIDMHTCHVLIPHIIKFDTLPNIRDVVIVEILINFVHILVT